MRVLTFSYTIQEVVPNVYTKFKILGAVVNFLTKTSIGGKENWTKKVNDKYEYAGSVLHNTTSHT